MRVFRGPFAEAQASIHRDAVGVYLVVVVVVVVVWFCGWYNSLYGHLLFGFFPFGLHLFYYRFCLFIILFPTPFPPLSLSLSISLSLSLSFFHSFQFSYLVQGSVANFDLFFVGLFHFQSSLYIYIFIYIYTYNVYIVYIQYNVFHSNPIFNRNVLFAFYLGFYPKLSLKEKEGGGEIRLRENGICNENSWGLIFWLPCRLLQFSRSDFNGRSIVHNLVTGARNLEFSLEMWKCEEMMTIDIRPHALNIVERWL